MIRLSVNVNKIALIRNARGGDIPSVVEAARICLEAGCHGITVHPRPDGRHIRYTDVYELALLLTQEARTVERQRPPKATAARRGAQPSAAGRDLEFNVEGYPSNEFLELVCSVRPEQATLVPDPPDTVTSNAGWRLGPEQDWLRGVIERLHENRIRVSLFMDPEVRQMKRVRELGADRIELYTGPYAEAFGTFQASVLLEKYREAAAAARQAGLGVNAGHDLNLKNIPDFAKRVPGVIEVSIGQALIADALKMGLTRTVRAYLDALGSRPRQAPPAQRSGGRGRARARR